MFLLILNDTRFPRKSISRPIARSEDEEELREFFHSQSVPSYYEMIDNKKIQKFFRKGGPLEWCSPPDETYGQGIIDVGTKEDWMKQAAEKLEKEVMEVPDVKDLPKLIVTVN